MKEEVELYQSLQQDFTCALRAAYANHYDTLLPLMAAGIGL